MCSSAEFQVNSNFSGVPLRLYLIFSIFRNIMMSLSHADAVGGIGDFQHNNILLLASRDVKAMTERYRYTLHVSLTGVTNHDLDLT